MRRVGALGVAEEGADLAADLVAAIVDGDVGGGVVFAVQVDCG